MIVRCPHGCWEPNPGFLKAQQILLTSKSPSTFFKNINTVFFLRSNNIILITCMYVWGSIVGGQWWHRTCGSNPSMSDLT